MRVCFIKLNVGRLQRQITAIRHRVAGIHSQVHDDLFDLARIRPHMPEAGGQNGNQFDIFANQAMKHFLGVAHDVFKSRPRGEKSCRRLKARS